MGPRTQDLDPWSQGRRYRKSRKKGLDVEWSKWLYETAGAATAALALSVLCLPPRWLCRPRRTKPGLSSPCSWHAQTLRPRSRHLPGRWEPYAALTAAHCSPFLGLAVSARCPTGEKPPAGTTGEKLGATELESRGRDSGLLRKGRCRCHQLSAHRGLVTFSSPGGGGSGVKWGLPC